MEKALKKAEKDPPKVDHQEEMKRHVKQAMIHFLQAYGLEGPWHRVEITLTPAGVAGFCVVVDQAEADARAPGAVN